MVSPLDVPQRKTQLTARNGFHSRNRRNTKSAPVTSCSHVDEGAIWCNDCASQFLVYARKNHAESVSPTALSASVNMLKRALSEYRLTSAGIASLERSYADHVAQKKFHEAESIAHQITEVKRLISERNHEAREIKRKRKVTQLNARSFAVYKAVPKTVDGRISTKDMQFSKSVHARERQLLRHISDQQVNEAFRKPAEFASHSRGKWAITGSNQVILLGVYSEDTEKNQSFRIITVYWVSTPDEEIAAELSAL